MKSWIRRSLALAGILLCSATWAQISDDVVKIGVITDMSGVFSDLGGKGSVVATEMAVQDFVEQKKPDFKVEMVSADHQNKADVASTIARKWYDVEQVDMITDALMSSAALAVSKITAAEDGLLLITGSGSNVLTNEQCSANTINYAWDSYSIVTSLARSITENGGKKWFFIAADYAFGKSIVEDATPIIEAAGGTVVGTVSHPVGTTDFSSFILQAQASGADVVGLATAGADQQNAVRSAYEFGLMGQQQVVMLAGNMMDVISLGLEQTQGMQLIEAFYWDMNDDTRAWSQRFQERAGKLPNHLNAGTYSAVWQYLNAVQRAGTDQAEAVLEQLRSQELNDMYAHNGHLRPDGLMVHDIYLLTVKAPKDSTGPGDVYDQAETVTIPGDQAYQPLSQSRCPLVTEGQKGA